MAEITQNYISYLAVNRSPWTVSLAELVFRVLQRDQPRVLLSGAETVSSSDQWHARVD